MMPPLPPLLRRLHPRRGMRVLALLDVLRLRRRLPRGVGELVHLLMVVIVRSPERLVGVGLSVRVLQDRRMNHQIFASLTAAWPWMERRPQTYFG